MRGASLVVTGENGIKFDNTVGGSLLDAAKECCLQTGLAGGADTAVDACRVALPNVDEEVRRRLAVLSVDKRNLEMQRDSTMSFNDIAADLLAVDEIRTDDVIRRQDTSAVGSEDFSVRGVGGVLELAGLVVGGGGPFCKGGVVAAVDVGMVVGDSPLLAETVEGCHAPI